MCTVIGCLYHMILCCVISPPFPQDEHSSGSETSPSPSKSKQQQRSAKRGQGVVESPADISPVDLTSYYSTQGGVDLETLSELTGMAGKMEEDFGGLRSKRKCVRVREEMSRLQELLETDTGTGDAKSGASRGGRGGVGRVRSPSDPFSWKPKTRSSGRSQFTHKRRRRRKQPVEEGRNVCTCLSSLY